MVPLRRLLLALTLVAAAGCAAPPAASRPPLAAPPPATEYLVREAQLARGAISVRLDIPFAPSGPKPAVIATGGSTRELLAAGYVGVTYSVNWPALKGPAPTPVADPVGTWVLASPSAAVLGERYLREIDATATEIVPQVLDWLQSMPDIIDGTRLGMIGASTNGFVALQAAAADRRLGVIVALAACGDFHRFLRLSSMGMQGAPLTLDPTYAAWVREREVARHPQRLLGRAVLMINRTQDLIIPVACADATAEALTRAFAAAGESERFSYLRVQGEGHGVGRDDIAATIAWLQRWL